MAKEKKVPFIIDRPMGFCPGCGHGIVIRLIGEALEELGQDKNVIWGIGVGCSSLLGGGLEADRLHCPHGRVGAVATAMKRVNPDNIVLAYQGDGDALSIGLAETTSAAYRNENITVFLVNNTNYGMTGGQMSNTTMPGQITATTRDGRDPATTGMPLKFPELVASQFMPAYVARGTVSSPANINKLKGYIKNAIQAQMNGEGYSLVEIISTCPTNWRLSPVQSMKKVDSDLLPYFPLGVLKDREAKN